MYFQGKPQAKARQSNAGLCRIFPIQLDDRKWNRGNGFDPKTLHVEEVALLWECFSIPVTTFTSHMFPTYLLLSPDYAIGPNSLYCATTSFPMTWHVSGLSEQLDYRNIEVALVTPIRIPGLEITEL